VPTYGEQFFPIFNQPIFLRVLNLILIIDRLVEYSSQHQEVSQVIIYPHSREMFATSKTRNEDFMNSQKFLLHFAAQKF